MPQSLVILNGNAPGTSRPSEPGAPVTIGRHPSREIQLDDERASRLHAKLIHHQGRWHIEDCGSLNGTQVNLQPIERAVLEPGDLIRIGERLILFADYTTDHGIPTAPSRPNPTSRMRQPAASGEASPEQQEESPSESERVTIDDLTIDQLIEDPQCLSAGEGDDAEPMIDRSAHDPMAGPSGRKVADVLRKRTPIVGSSEAIRDVLEQVSRVGPTPSTVLIFGESGTGKELVARVIHELSPRRSEAYIPINCATISESLLESELFGHEEGAFTGANRRHAGQFERAHGGTLFLDEIGEMSLPCQAKLLRVLEGHPFQRVGGDEAIRVDVRVVAATHRDLMELVEQSQFRADLYYRLRVIDIRMPPLRERDNDAVELAQLFLVAYCGRFGRGRQRFSAEAVEAIRRHHWPGNVRELKNAVERAVVLSRTSELTPKDLGLASDATAQVAPSQPTVAKDAAPDQSPKLTSLKEAEYRHIREVLEQVGGNKSLACKVLGIGRGTLYKKLEELDRLDK